ncbi:MAG: hypothetical protein KGI73_01580 [Patescibacteria group bacterium]|nr:hypothetical protein [Patescibacteria group bacterium]
MLEGPLGKITQASEDLHSAGKFVAVLISGALRGRKYLQRKYTAAEMACQLAHLELATSGAWKMKRGLHLTQQACRQAERMNRIHLVAQIFGYPIEEHVR